MTTSTVQETKSVKGLNTAPSRLRMAIGIATRGRPAVLLSVLQDLRNQSRPADVIVVAYAEDGDVGEGPLQFAEVTFVRSAPGLTKQRNAVLQTLADEDVVTFLDDDFYLERTYLARMEVAFLADARLVVATGRVLADGIHGVEIDPTSAKRILVAGAIDKANDAPVPVFNAYGCNMSLRLQTIRDHDLRFDEELPLYGWYEDVEFSRQLAEYGSVMRMEACQGVHLGVKGGRQSGLRLGYSQVANPFYLARRHRVSWIYAACSMLSRSMKNFVLSIRPEPMIDRRGRLRGNAKAWLDLVRGSIHPNRIIDL